MNNPEKIVICVCTRERPIMLNNCLESLISQEIHDEVEVEIVVVENNTIEQVKEVVNDIRSRSPFSVFYVHQPILGIPQARNSALTAAHHRGADWIAFIDDDDVADRKWVYELMQAQKKYNADVVTGPQFQKFPADTKKWKKSANFGVRLHKEGEERRTAATNNALIRADFIRKNNISFDNSLSFHSGEDTLFFFDITRNGGKLVWTNNAVVTETLPIERTTLRWHWMHSKHFGIHCVYTRQIMGESTLDLKIKSLRQIIKGISKIAITPIMLVVGRGGKTLFSGVKNIAKGYGIILGLMKVKSNHYRNVTGY